MPKADGPSRHQLIEKFSSTPLWLRHAALASGHDPYHLEGSAIASEEARHRQRIREKARSPSQPSDTTLRLSCCLWSLAGKGRLRRCMPGLVRRTTLRLVNLPTSRAAIRTRVRTHDRDASLGGCGRPRPDCKSGNAGVFNLFADNREQPRTAANTKLAEGVVLQSNLLRGRASSPT